MESRIEQIIEEIEEFIDGCKFQALSTTKIVVNKEELEELLRELRLKTPDEIKRYQKIISNKDAILADAQSKADQIIADAKAEAQKIVSESEVMQQAYAQANETINKSNQQAQDILDSATEDANNIRSSAISYTDELMESVQNIVENTLNDVVPRFNGLSESLKSALDIVKSNRSELSAPSAAESASVSSYDYDINDDPESDFYGDMDE
ncbi:MAG: ATPase [Lachnospiraceae bacterium]|jgi:ABC-type transporter Mla subunit MlaD